MALSKIYAPSAQPHFCACVGCCFCG